MFLTLAAYLHDIDPYAIKLWEGGPIRWYGLSYLLGFVLAFLLIRRVARAGVSSLAPQHAGDLVFVLALGVVVGGRLGYVLFYRPELLAFTARAPFWGVLALNEGGMASHGGILGGILASAWYAYRHEHRWTHILDLLAFGAPLGLFFGRIANFVNGELYGRGPTSVPWAVKFPQEMFNWSNEQLAQLTPALEHLPPSQAEGGLHIYQIIGAIQRGNQGVIAVVEPLLTPRHPSQLYQALLEGLLVFIVLAILWVRPRKPMVIGAVAAMSYSTARIIGEFFRTPDEHIADQEFAAAGITRGQWLSALLLLAGVVLLVVFSGKDNPRMGGWWQRDESGGRC